MKAPPLALYLAAQNVPCALDARRWVLTRAVDAGRSNLFLLRAGLAQAQLLDETAQASGPCLIWLPTGTAHFCEYAAGASGTLFSATDDFLDQIIETTTQAAALRRLWGRSIIVGGELVAAALDELTLSFAVITREVRAPQRASSALVAAHLTIILLHLWRLASLPAAATRSRPHQSLVIERFFDLVEAHFVEHWTVRRYAEALAISEDRLQGICRRITGRGPLAHIHGRSIDEARKRLARSALPIENIATQLGFSDPGYFNRFFKRHVGHSPGAYRKRATAVALEAASFATWP